VAVEGCVERQQPEKSARNQRDPFDPQRTKAPSERRDQRLTDLTQPLGERDEQLQGVA
jgi:hypothetical protein